MVYIGRSMHLKGEMRNGENFGHSSEPLFSHPFQTQRLHALPSASQGSCLQITWREWYWACPPPNLRIFCELWREVLFLFYLHLFTIPCAVKKPAISRWCSCSCSSRTAECEGAVSSMPGLPTRVVPKDQYNQFKDAVRSPISFFLWVTGGGLMTRSIA